jgi:hypothetical protein
MALPTSEVTTAKFQFGVDCRRRCVGGQMPSSSSVAQGQISFEDGAAYERMMGTWSRLAGEVFLDWLAPLSALCWIDVGCGNGAFTEVLVERCAPNEVQGIVDMKLSGRSQHDS